MAEAELIVDVHHHFMPPILFDRLAAQAGGKRIVTKEISLTLHPSRKDLEAHLKCMDEAGITVAILTDQVQLMGADVTSRRDSAVASIYRFMSRMPPNANLSAASMNSGCAPWRCSPATSRSSST